MKLSRFAGGIHPEMGKPTASRPIEQAPLPEQAIIPLVQHIGAPCQPQVKPGDEVTVGQVVGQAQGFVSAAVHASISGKVTKVGPHPHPSGKEVPAVFIHAQAEQPPLPEEREAEPLALPPEEIRRRIQEAGVVGLGGATFPTHVKLSPPEGKSIDTLIINGAECEPVLSADHRLMVERAEELVLGIRLLMRVLGVERALVGIERNKPEAISALEAAAEGTGIEVVGLPVRYPQGSEKHLIKTLLDREVPPPPGLPLDVGVVVQNVGTVCAVYDAVVRRRPLVERVVTVAGAGVREKKNLLVRIGTPVRELVELCGGLKEDAAKVILGGPMMGVAQYTLDVPVIKGTSGVVVLSRAEVEDGRYRNCIRCGKCVAACPMLLLPYLLGIYAERRLFAEAEALDVMACLECGCCVYVCPAKRPMVQLIRLVKAQIVAQRKKAA